MRASAELATAIPQDMVEEFVKRLAYVSQEISNPDLLHGARRVAFDVQPGFEERTDQVMTYIREVAEKLCRNYRAGSFKTHARRDKQPSSLSGDPHPLLE